MKIVVVSGRPLRGSAARRFVEANWTWEAHFLELERVLFDVVNGRDA